MNITGQIAKQLREFHLGGNWTDVNLKDVLEDVSWQEATTKVNSFNTIAVLVYHMNYYVTVAIKVIQGLPPDASDKDSFNLPPVQSQQDWKNLINKTWTDVENFAVLLENFPDDKLGDVFLAEKYGNYYRNFHGIIEHCHYHLGQIVLLKKMIRQDHK